MGVRDYLPIYKLVRMVRDLERGNQEIKAMQRVGQSSVRTARVFSANSYDLQVPESTVARKIVVEFIPDDMTFGGALCYDLLIKVMDSSGAIYPSAPIKERQVRSDRRQMWTIYAQPYYPVQRLKFYFVANRSGTFTANLI